MQILLCPFSTNSNIIYSFAQDTYLGLFLTHSFLSYPHSIQWKILPTYPQSAFWVQPLLIFYTADMVVYAKLVSHTNLIDISAAVLSPLRSQFNSHESQSDLVKTSANCVLLFPQSSHASLDPQHPESSPRSSRTQDLSSGNFPDLICNYSVHGAWPK